jgi:hypothetical protein
MDAMATKVTGTAMPTMIPVQWLSFGSGSHEYFGQYWYPGTYA